MNENELRKLRSVECSIRWLIMQCDAEIKPLEKCKASYKQRVAGELDRDRGCYLQCLGILQGTFTELTDKSEPMFKPLVQNKTKNGCQQMFLEFSK